MSHVIFTASANPAGIEIVDGAGGPGRNKSRVKNWRPSKCRTHYRGTESTPTSPPLERRRRARWRRVATSNRDIQSDVANERNWTATQRNQVFPELRAARDFKGRKLSSSWWKVRGRGREGLGEGCHLAPGGRARRVPASRAAGGARPERPPLGAGHAAAAARPRPPPPPPLPLALPAPSPHVWVTSKFREKAACWLLRRRRDSVAQRAPPGRRRGGRRSEPAGSLSSRRPGPADAGGQTPPAPDLTGKVTFIKRRHFQGYFRPREAAESDRKRGKVRVSLLFIFFPREGRKMRGGQTDGRRS